MLKSSSFSVPHLPGRSGISQVAAGIFFLFTGLMHGILDTNRDGISDIWSAMNLGVTPDNSDPDQDGFSSFEEMIAGTDPRDASSFLAIEKITSDETQVFIHWDSVAGKSYRVERINSNGTWSSVFNLFPEPLSRKRKLRLPQELGTAIIRITAKDVDVDRDSLTGWEEAQLGWSDLDFMSASRETGESDILALYRQMESTEGRPLPGVISPLRISRPNRADAYRFLMMSSFGPTNDLSTDLSQKGFSVWVDDQLAIPQTKSTELLFQNGYSDFEDPTTTDAWRQTWWRLLHQAPDQLRQRIAYALSQILVVRFVGGELVGQSPEIQSHYYDFFISHADRSYRELLEEVTYSPTMGWYLSHLRNRKANPEINRFPDENFAREIMQLFTVGLWELESDGTRKTDEEGNFIPTYDNTTISETARILTGMSFSTTLRGASRTTWFFDAGLPPHDWNNPMRFFPEEHDQGAKTIIRDVEIPAGMDGDDELEILLDTLCEHPSSAPFLSRLLIQRFTASNPSPEYIQRVSSVWQETGGRIDHVVRAILLDPDVLFPNPLDDTAGKLREPLICFTHFSRTFGYTHQNPDQWRFEYHKFRNIFGQYGMQAPSVFNFYLPDFSPSGEMADRSLYSPESQLMQADRLLQISNRYRTAIELGYNLITTDFSHLHPLAHSPGLLVTQLDIILTGGRLESADHLAIVAAVQTTLALEKRVEIAIHAITHSPAFTVIR